VASIIAGATAPEQAQSNAQAANWSLSETELVEVNRILTGYGAEALQ